MAVKHETQGMSAGRRRWVFGANVTLAIVLMAALVVLINVAANWKLQGRHDFTGGFSSHRLSDRTKRVLDKVSENMRLSTVYISDEQEKDRRKYLPTLRDFCEEMHQYKPAIQVEHLSGADQRKDLRDRVGQKFGTAAEKYSEVVSLTLSTWDELDDKLAPARASLTAMQRGNSWIGTFPTLANITRILAKDVENIKETRKEVEDAVHGEGLPRYQEANTKIRTANDELKKHLDETQSWMKDMDKLVAALSDPNSDFVKTTRENNEVLKGLLLNLNKIIGDPSEKDVPEDPKPVIQDFAKACGPLADWLVGENSRVEAFVKEYPGIEQHPSWAVEVQQGPFNMQMPLSALLAQSAESINGAQREVRKKLSNEVPKDQMQNIVRQLRQFAARKSGDLNTWITNINTILNDGAQIDAESKQFIASGAAGDLFKEVTSKLNDISTKITQLPELKMDEVAEKLQQDNIVVIETDKDVRVVSFDDVWPNASQERFGSGEEEESLRVFDGDTAISSSLISLQNEKPVATVVFVAYEMQPPPEMRQFQRPNTGPISLDSLNTLKERLKKANFAVKDWNLGAEGTDAAKAPNPEEGTQNVYVLLPPAEEPPPNPMMRQQQEKKFGPAELDKIRKALGDDGRAMFLACYLPPKMSMWGPMGPAEYAFDQLLQDEYGVKVQFDNRVVLGLPDRKQPGRYGIDIVKWWYMPLNDFTDNPIGKPLRARRMLMRDVCPVKEADKIPDGVTLSSVLDVSDLRPGYWAESDIESIARALRSGNKDSFFTKSKDAIDPPFAIIKAVEKKKDDKLSRVLVMGNGLSLREDYLAQRVMHFGKNGRLITDPPPLENVDLVLNSLYWLTDHADMIASGPADVPLVGQVSRSGKLSALVFGWAALTMVIGGFVLVVRRK